MLPSIFAPWCRPHHPADGGFFYINTFKRTSEVEAHMDAIFSIVYQWPSTNIDDSHRDLPSGVYRSVCLIAWFFSLFHRFLHLLLWVFCAFLRICMCVLECESGTHHTLRCRKTPSTCRGHRPLCPADRQSNLEWEREREMRPLVM